jgi:hypothetical protein
VLAGVAILGAYVFFIRPWQLRWGATDEEVERPMPGDGVVQNPTFVATRAVTINATPDDVWPWIIQIGYGRAGWYSYDWIDNLGRPSADNIIPELQHLEVGDLVPIIDGFGYKRGLRVAALDPPHAMVWIDDGPGDQTTWVWGLYPINERSTRLITRVRIRYEWTKPTILFNLAVDVGDVVMMRKCMVGIKKRAERTNQGAGGPLNSKAEG